MNRVAGLLIIPSMGGGSLATSVRRGGLGRAAVIAFVALHLAAMVLGLAHQAAARHVVCAEHGELIDVPIVAVPTPARADAAAPTLDQSDDDGDDDNLGTSPSHARWTAHDHCALASLDDDAIAPAVRAAIAAPALASISLAPAPAAPAPSSLPVLSVAPKTSPPT